MADKTPDQLTAMTTAVATDLVMVYDITAALLKKMDFETFTEAVSAVFGDTHMMRENNLSDVLSVSTSRANLGLGSAAVLASSALFQVANNFNEVASASTARTNIGAAAADAPTITSGMTYSGSTKQNVQALGALDINVALGEFFTKSISTNSTFTFSGVTAAKAQGFILDLTITSAAVPTWPAAVLWAFGNDPSLGNGRHIIGFLTLDGGTSWVGFVGAQSVA